MAYNDSLEEAIKEIADLQQKLAETEKANSILQSIIDSKDKVIIALADKVDILERIKKMLYHHQ